MASGFLRITLFDNYILSREFAVTKLENMLIESRIGP